MLVGIELPTGVCYIFSLHDKFHCAMVLLETREIYFVWFWILCSLMTREANRTIEGGHNTISISATNASDTCNKTPFLGKFPSQVLEFIVCFLSKVCCLSLDSGKIKTGCYKSFACFASLLFAIAVVLLKQFPSEITNSNFKFSTI